MTKKDFILIAEAIKSTKQNKSIETKKQTLSYLLGYLAEGMKEDNENFKKDVFYKASGFKNLKDTF